MARARERSQPRPSLLAAMIPKMSLGNERPEGVMGMFVHSVSLCYLPIRKQNQFWALGIQSREVMFPMFQVLNRE